MLIKFISDTKIQNQSCKVAVLNETGDVCSIHGRLCKLAVNPGANSVFKFSILEWNH